jgi:hypothetical protein
VFAVAACLLGGAVGSVGPAAAAAGHRAPTAHSVLAVRPRAGQASATVFLPVDQWLATGRVTSVSSATVVRVGDVRVRAWFFKPSC